MRKGTKATGTGGGITSLAALCVALVVAPAAAAPTPAGTTIRNVATLDLGTRTIASNEVALTVARLIDVAVVAVVPRAPIVDVRADVAFDVRNPGNAEQRILLVATVPGDATAAISVDGSPVDAIVLAPGEERRVVVTVGGLDRGAGDVAVSLGGTAAEGHGAPGSVIGDPAAGAIAGPGGAAAIATTVLTAAGGASAGPVLSKTQSVLAPDGSARVMPGATITYRLEARFDAPTPAVAIDDRIPLGTTFVPGSITLDGAAQADAARFDGTGVHVALGDVAGAAVHVVQFKVNIQ
ncbi:hypothetical protein [Sphingomonas sp. Leaf412]|uniref:hypothetical protein n=1 Tax=Sphingomonas sp. Leaf412 TaxID=1736370 RepID=UPI000B225276|nr:hypothetical protein [Sphingomonas sp. Leaf412]